MINLESTNFTALKNIVKNVEGIYDVSQDWDDGIQNVGLLRKDLIPFLEDISDNVFTLLGRKKG